MTFERTPKGSVAQHLFHSLPIVYIEGETDVSFYHPVLPRDQFKLELLHGKERANLLIQELVSSDLPYMIILDGDYDILNAQATKHRRLVRLARYSFENYFWAKEIVESFCLDATHCTSQEKVLGTLFEDAQILMSRELLELLILDIASRTAGAGIKVLPDRIDEFFDKSGDLNFDTALIKKRVALVAPQISTQATTEARRALAAFLRTGHIADILKGHCLFGIIRRLLRVAIRRKKGRNPTLEDNFLRIILSALTWRLSPSQEHRALKRKIRRAARELQELPAS
jgi:hypothetical protein